MPTRNVLESNTHFQQSQLCIYWIMLISWLVNVHHWGQTCKNASRSDAGCDISHTIWTLLEPSISRLVNHSVLPHPYVPHRRQITLHVLYYSRNAFVLIKKTAAAFKSKWNYKEKKRKRDCFLHRSRGPMTFSLTTRGWLVITVADLSGGWNIYNSTVAL